MEKPAILITGATGSTGAPTVEMLLQKGYQVNALVHSEDARSARLKTLGAKIIVGDMQNINDVRAAWKDVKRGYFCYPLSPDLLDATVIFAQAAKEAGAEYIVNLSQKQVTKTSQSPATIRHFLSEQVFNWSGIPVTHLRPTFFSEWFMYIASQIQNEKMRMPFPENARHAPVAAQDLARTIANILVEPGLHINKTYQLFGPEVLSYTEIGKIFSNILNKNIVYEQVSVQEMADSIGLGNYDHFKNHVAKVIDDNLFAEPNMNDVIETITGKKPMTLAEFIDNNRAVFTV